MISVPKPFPIEFRRDVVAVAARDRRRCRNPLPAIHGLLAATARARGLILVTCDLAPLARSDVRVLNPFDPPGRSKMIHAQPGRAGERRGLIAREAVGPLDRFVRGSSAGSCL
jgi:hypothetical protein